MQRTTAEIAEIERHKYFLSEKEGYDVGWEFAEADWEAQHASRWRREHAASGTPVEAAGSCCGGASGMSRNSAAAANRSSTTSTAASRGDTAPEEKLTGNGHVVRCDPGSGAGPLRRFFARLFGNART